MASKKASTDASRFRKHVLVCTKTGEGRCGDKGGFDVFMALRRANHDDAVLVTQCGCTGQHETGPTVIMYPEGVWYQGVRPEDADDILNERAAGLVNPRVRCGLEPGSAAHRAAPGAETGDAAGTPRESPAGPADPASLSPFPPAG